MKMTMKELDSFTSTVTRVKLSVEGTLSKCSASVRKDLTGRLAEFTHLWESTRSAAEEGRRDFNHLCHILAFQSNLGLWV